MVETQETVQIMITMNATQCRGGQEDTMERVHQWATRNRSCGWPNTCPLILHPQASPHCNILAEPAVGRQVKPPVGCASVRIKSMGFPGDP